MCLENVENTYLDSLKKHLLIINWNRIKVFDRINKICLCNFNTYGGV